MTRWLAGFGLVGALLQLLGGILETTDRVLPGESGFTARASAIGFAYLMLMAAVIGVARSGAASGSWPARLGFVSASIGWALSAVAQFVLQVDVALAETVLFPTATVLIGLGMLVAGIAVVRANRWRGWRRITPLICGLYPFVVIFPAFAATGGPNFLVLSGWGLCWLALGASLWKEA